MVCLPFRFENFHLLVSRVIASLKVGKRQAEAPFVNLKIAAKGQRSVYGMFKKPVNPEGSLPQDGASDNISSGSI